MTSPKLSVDTLTVQLFKTRDPSINILFQTCLIISYLKFRPMLRLCERLLLMFLAKNDEKVASSKTKHILNSRKNERCKCSHNITGKMT